MFGTLPPYMSLLCYANFDPLNILSSVFHDCKTKTVVPFWLDFQRYKGYIGTNNRVNRKNIICGYNCNTIFKIFWQMILIMLPFMKN